MKFIIYRSGIFRISWKWKLVARNNEILASARGFNTESIARENIYTIIGYIKSNGFDIISM